MKTVKQKKPKKPRKMYLRFRYKHPIIFYTFLLAFIGSLLGAYFVINYVSNVLEKTPTITGQMLKSEPTSNMYDNKGRLIWSETKFRRDYITKDKIPDLYKDLLLSTEDKTFYTDPGFSWKGIANAGVSTAQEKLGKGVSRGGSSIEQQLIKNVAFSSNLKDRTIDRKIKELWLAQQLYENYSKDQILEWYINKIEMGENSYGANTAAITYYGKSLDKMAEYSPENISKLATIAGLGQAPSTYNIYNSPKAAKERRDIVLYSAYMNNKLTEVQYEAALKVNIKKDLKPRYWRNKESLNETSKYTAYVNSVLKQIKDLGYDINKTPIQIYTELDQKSNEWLKNTVNNYGGYKDKDQQVAVTVINPKNGIVIAQSGGRNVTDPYAINRATQTSRSSGSTIKPFIDYGPSIEYLGYGTNYKLSSSPYKYPGTNFYAQNFGGYTYGIVDMKKALRLSLNTPAIRLLDEHVGSNRAKEFLSHLNLDTKKYYGAGDALGLDVSTEQLANAYATLSNNGNYNQPRYIDKIKFADGSEKKIRFNHKRAMKQSTSYILLKILEGTTASDGATRDSYIKEFKGHAAKSGTVAYDMNSSIWRPDTAASDAWIAGTTKSVAMAIWTGYDSPNKPGHWVLEEQKARHNLYKKIMRHFNYKKDTSDWAKPNTVYQSGRGLSADYSPTDLNDISINLPFIDETRFNNVYNNLSKNKLSNIKQAELKKYKIPSGYKEKDWYKKLNKSDKLIYDKWISNQDYPNESDLPLNIWRD